MQSTREDAYRILEFDEYIGTLPFDTVKKRYRLLALKHHPDKSRDPASKERFIEIQEAYRFLKSSDEPSIGNSFNDDASSSAHEDNSYDAMMDAFLKTVKPKYALLIKKLLRILSNSKLNDFLKRINRDTVGRMRDFMAQYKDAFHIDETHPVHGFACSQPETDMEDAEDVVVSEKITYILNPFIEDLMEDNAFRLNHNGKPYLVPLWHPETVFEDDAGEEFRVICYPILPDNMDIDDQNILTVWLDLGVSDVWNRDSLEMMIGSKLVKLPTDLLRMTDRVQEAIVMGAGVPLANQRDVFDASQRQPIRFRVSLTRDHPESST